MPIDYATLSLPQIFFELEAISSEAERQFGSLNAEQLNWKPSNDQWSVAQCLEHLIKTNREFYPIIDAVTNGTYRTKIWQRVPLLPRLFGQLLIKSLAPAGTRKFKAAAVAQPSTSAIDAQIINRFGADQTSLKQRFERLADKQLEQTIISSPLASFVTYRLLDAGRIFVAHGRRHLAQAERVTQTPGFPALT